MSDCEKKLITQVDLARQATILTGNTACFDGKIQAGIPFSGYPSGVDVDTIVLLNPNDGDLQTAVFSGNSLFSHYNVTDPSSPDFIPSYLTGETKDFVAYSSLTWTNPLYSATTSYIPVGINPNTVNLGTETDPFFSGVTTFILQTITVGPFWDVTLSGTNGTHNIALEYSGYSIEYNWEVDTANASGATLDPLDISGDGTVGVVNGLAISAQTFTANTGHISATYLEFSARSLDYTGPLDYLRSREDATIDNKLTTDKIRIRGGASLGTIGYVLTQDEEDGTGVWAPATGGSGGTGSTPNYINSASTPTTVGGILAGSSFPAPGKTMQEMWDHLLYPYIPPVFNLFTRSNLSSSYEIGEETTPVVPVGETFNWSTTQPGNVDDLIPNSVKVTDSGGNILLDSQAKAGSGVPATIVISNSRTSVGSETLYTVHGINTQGASFTRNISATWKSYVYYGMGGLTLNGVQMVALSNSQFVTSLGFGSVLTVANSGSNYLWVCVPDILTNVGSWTSAGAPITDFAGVTPIPGSFQTDISITNSQGVPVNYKVWRQTFAQTSNPYKFQLNNV